MGSNPTVVTSRTNQNSSGLSFFYVANWIAFYFSFKTKIVRYILLQQNSISYIYEDFFSQQIIKTTNLRLLLHEAAFSSFLGFYDALLM